MWGQPDNRGNSRDALSIFTFGDGVINIAIVSVLS